MLEMSYKICPYCKCLIKENGFCRNASCKLGQKGMATPQQLYTINNLCIELGIDISDKNPDKLPRDKAGKLIKDLIARKALQEVDL
jgi:hypothetical protein